MFKPVALALAALMVCAAPALAQTVPAPPPADGRPIVIGQSYPLRSAVLNEWRAINVWLPPGYDTSRKTYPVVYLLDGGETEDFHHITGLFQVASMNGFMRDAIVIGIADTDRRRDLAHPTNDPRDRKDYPTAGSSEPFRRFLADELQPWVNDHYRTSGERVLIGESLAGLFTVETFLKAPQLFDSYIAISPSLWWDNGSLAKEAATRLRAMPAGKRFLYLSIGDEGGEMLSGVETLTAALKVDAPTGVTWTYEPAPTEGHGTIYHPMARTALMRVFGIQR